MSNNAMAHSTHSLYKANIVDNVIADSGDELKLAIQGMSLFKCTVITSLLNDCTLFNCTVLSCTIFNSKLDNCIIRQCVQPSLHQGPFHLHNNVDSQDIPPTHTRKPSILRTCQATGCFITKSIISRHCKVEGGELSSCNVQNSTIGKILVCETSILSCNVNNCILIVSRQHGCKMLQTSKSGCKALSTLKFFPPEIRSVIFKHSMELDGLLSKHMPALITALRPDRTLYYEALGVLRKESYFIANMSNIFTISNSRAGYVRKLVLRYEYFHVRLTL
jgi:hypothetical protein